MCKAIGLILMLLMLLLTGCATNLSEAGRKIKIHDAGSVSGCTSLGDVTGESPSLLSGGDYGVFYATVDARNKAARIPEADTLVITDNQSRRLGGEVFGIAYNCHPQRTVTIPKAPVATAPKAPVPVVPRDGIFEKAKKCQARGGVWVNNQCVIQIE
jgi:hypothetical protein